MALVRAMGSKPASLISKIITENGTYNASSEPGNIDGYSSVEVDVPDPVVVPKIFTENGVYNPHDEPGNPYGYGTVTVNVPTGGEVTQGISYFTHTVDNSAIDTYTAEFDGKYLVINLEVVGQSSSAHNTQADILTTGQIVSKDIAYTTGNNNTRDCTMCVGVVEVQAGDAITFENSSLSGHVSRLHVIVPCTDIEYIDNTLMDAIVDSSRDDVIYTSGLTPALAICIHISDSNENMLASISGDSGLICKDQINVRKCSFSMAVMGDDWETSMSTTNQSNYTSRIYSVWNISQ